MGDVVGLADSSGSLRIGYFYDAYGAANYSAYGNADASTLAAINPLTYRSYVLDQGTGLYYLQSRYYEFAIGRFINGDLLLTPANGFVGNNLFVYCGNNPVNNIDPNGYCYYNSEGQWCHDNWEYYGDYERKPDPGNYTPYRDVTREVCQALIKSATYARGLQSISHSIGGNLPLTTLSIRCLIFKEVVDHSKPWDIKREEPWIDTIGTRYLGENSTVIFLGEPTPIDKLGNYTYGFLGYAYGIPLPLLIIGSYYAANFPTSGFDLKDELLDWCYVLKGYITAKLYYMGG